MNIEQAKEKLKIIIDFYKLNDENNYDYSDDVLISMKLVLEEIERLNNIINELEKYIHNELVLDFYNDDMSCELIINKMEKMIKELKEGNKDE